MRLKMNISGTWKTKRNKHQVDRIASIRNCCGKYYVRFTLVRFNFYVTRNVAHQNNYTLLQL